MPGAQVFSPLELPELEITRTGNLMCRRAVPADFIQISFMQGGFQYDYQKK
jgi:hypothetical protein